MKRPPIVAPPNDLPSSCVAEVVEAAPTIRLRCGDLVMVDEFGQAMVMSGASRDPRVSPPKSSAADHRRAVTAWLAGGAIEMSPAQWSEACPRARCVVVANEVDPAEMVALMLMVPEWRRRAAEAIEMVRIGKAEIPRALASGSLHEEAVMGILLGGLYIPEPLEGDDEEQLYPTLCAVRRFREQLRAAPLGEAVIDPFGKTHYRGGELCTHDFRTLSMGAGAGLDLERFARCDSCGAWRVIGPDTTWHPASELAPGQAKASES